MFILNLDRFSGRGLYLLLELRVDIVDEFRSDEHAGEMVSCLLETSLSALSNGGGQDVNLGRWEHRNVFAYSNEHSGSTKMVAHSNKSFCKLEGVEVHELVVEVKWYF